VVSNLKVIKNLIIVLGMTAVAASCASAPSGATVVDDPGDLPALQAVLKDRLSQLKTGMSLDEFRRLMPEAYVGGQNDATTAYEIELTQKYVTQEDLDRQNLIWGVGSPRARSKKEALWFYFYKDQLVKWGRPQDWPDKPDFILETRVR
jgi:hypothetical protein